MPKRLTRSFIRREMVEEIIFEANIKRLRQAERKRRHVIGKNEFRNRLLHDLSKGA